MKKILILILILGFFLPANNTWAKFPDDLPGPNIMPDSPFYFLKIWYEKIVLFFTFNLEKKAEKYKIFAEKRAYEIKQLITKGKGDLAEKPKEIYKSYLDKAKQKLEKAIQKAIDKKKDDLRQRLEQKLEEIKNKIMQTINLW